jgi:hypothetical protein
MMDFVKQHEAQNLADSRYRLQPIQGVGIMLLGGFQEGEFHLAKQRRIIPDQ